MKHLMWQDFWKCAEAWYGVTAEAAEWAHDWCTEWDYIEFHGAAGSELLEDLLSGLKQDVEDGCGTAHDRNMIVALAEVLGDVD